MIKTKYNHDRTKEVDEKGRTSRHRIEKPNMSNDDWNKQMLKEIDDLKKLQEENPGLCNHCTTISLCERYEELKATGYLK